MEKINKIFGSFLVCIGAMLMYLYILAGLIGGVATVVPLYMAGASVIEVVGMFVLAAAGYGLMVFAIGFVITFVGAILIK